MFGFAHNGHRALAEPRGMRPRVAHCHFSLGKLYRRTGQHQQAQEQGMSRPLLNLRTE